MAEPANGYARFGTVATTIAACLTAFLGLSGMVWFAISVAIAPMQREIDQIKADNQTIHSQIVPRDEHNRYDELQKARFDDLQRQVTKNGDDIKAIYTPGDAIKRLQERIDQLDAEVHHDRKP